ncbi:hypothetical protein RchiOBHm_Chr3g0486081 [Rosa chinensis]|uniref:Uncharacterized protein n=1 Tax=Rosa chinensis TaxID=74649 RepID=A0A2P6RF57_ROSCH|nr:hypothetical protein RchiOBHm_Chr3g0486081 [Rosa chinensis]
MVFASLGSRSENEIENWVSAERDGQARDICGNYLNRKTPSRNYCDGVSFY